MRQFARFLPLSQTFLRPLSRIPAIFAALLCLLALASTAASAAGGALIGTTITAFPGGDNESHRVLVQPDGRVVMVGYARYGTHQFAMIRYNADGTLDTSFGTGGVKLEYLAQGDSQAWAGLLQPDGRIVLGGYAVSDRSRFGIARFNSDGSLDTSFGGGGKVVAIGSGDAAGYAMALQSDGRILMGGYSMSGGVKVFTVMRFNADDTIDTTYGNGGFYVSAPGASDAVIHSMAIQPDGNVVVAGDGGGTNSIQMQRLTANGALDATFGTNGTATFSNMTGAWDMALQPDGKIAVAGASIHPATSQSSAFWDMAVLRANAGGTVDTTFGNTFGNNGIGYFFVGDTTIAAGDIAGYGIALDSDGTLVASGFVQSASSSGAAIGRLLADGSCDTTFGKSCRTGFGTRDKGYGLGKTSNGYVVAGSEIPIGRTDYDALAVAFDTTGGLGNFNGLNGFASLDVGSATAAAKASALQSDGKLVVVGTTTAENHASPGHGTKTGIVARYLANGTLDTGFGSGGIAKLAAESDASAVAIQGDGKIVVGGTLGAFGTDPALWFSRVNPDGTVDTGFGSGGNVSTTAASTTEGINALALQADGKIVGAGFVQSGTFSDTAFVRLTAGGALDSTFGSGGIAVCALTTGTDQATAVLVQGDGKIVGTGWAEVSGSQVSMGATRVNVDGSIDTSFGTNGVVTVNFGTSTSHGFAAVLQPDGKIVIGGSLFNGSTDDFALARLTSTGALDASFGSGGVASSDFGNHNRIFGLALLPSGKLVGAGETGGLYAVVQYHSNGTLDTAFGTGGSTAVIVNAGIDNANALTVGSDGTLYASGNASGAFGLARFTGDGTLVTPTVSLGSSINPSASGQTVTFTATASGSAGTPTGSMSFLDGATTIAACASQPLSGGTASCATSGLGVGTHSITAHYSGDSVYGAATSNAISQVVQSGSSALSLSPASIDFGGESMGTTSPPRTITVTNNGGVTVSVSGIAASTQFAQTNDCTSLAAGASCTISVTFDPAANAGAINSTAAVPGTVTVSSDAAGSPNAASLSGSAEKSLVTHFYESILRRAPDAGGKSFWFGETSRMASLGADVNETWYAMAAQFFFSAEYLALARDNAGFVTDLYNTFFNRPPDAGGLSFWQGQLDNGMPREVVLVSFMLSPEFTSFTQGIFGNTAARPEVNMVMDFYRGLLARLPDSGGFSFWVGQFRTAQCQGAGAVFAQVESISASFADGAEYAGRNRTNAQYVGDLYNSFLRRGGDAQGVQFWIQQLDSGAQTRDQVRQAFISTPEFTNRVNAVIAAGCIQ